MNPIVKALQDGKTVVDHKESGNSMRPIIKHRQPVTIAPVNPENLEKGDIVLAHVSGRLYTHLVSAVDHPNKRVQISNNRGRINGWTSYNKVYGIVTHIQGTHRSSATDDKIRTKDS